jgi:hypothetical protein
MNKYEQEYFTEIVRNSNNLTDICRNLGIGTTKGNRDTVKKYILKYGLDISHFKIVKKNIGYKKEICEILVENSTYTYTTSLKNKLYKEGFKDRKCELCNQGEEWNGMKISLILDHINGINDDNRIENLRIICPNCNAGLETNGGKNIKYKYFSKIKLNKCQCGEVISNSAKRCKVCDEINQRKVIRPDYDILLIEIEKIGYSGVGKKYNVSDNSVRKWKKYYEKISSN